MESPKPKIQMSQMEALDRVWLPANEFEFMSLKTEAIKEYIKEAFKDEPHDTAEEVEFSEKFERKKDRSISEWRKFASDWDVVVNDFDVEFEALRKYCTKYNIELTD